MTRGRNAGGGRRRGKGRGMGRGMRGSCAGGGGMGRGWAADNAAADRRFVETGDLELDARMLQIQAEEMEDRLRAIRGRIFEIQGGKSGAAVTGGRERKRVLVGNGTRRLTATVQGELCVSCGVCIDMCPEGAITLHDIAEIDPRKCTGCGSCLNGCPSEAIMLAESQEPNPFASARTETGCQ